jgi:hypothetical protein|nr:MAG TPA: hypothetical protein [Caudoviricetes sp.]
MNGKNIKKHLNALSTRSCTISDQNIRYVRLFGPGNTLSAVITSMLDSM